MTAPGIIATDVRRAFGHVEAVRSVTFHAQPGRVTGLVGPNGSGKTTLLLMLASLLAPDAGELRIDGIDPVARPQAARAVLGWMPDALGAWGSLTARETLVTTAKLYGMPRGAASARAASLLDTVGLDDLADEPARVFSRGQKQRLGLARALVHEPRVLLLDEPASGLDPQARADLRVLLRRLAADGATVLISSHVLSELDELVDDAVFLVQGETVGAERVAAAARRARTWRVRVGAAPVAEAAASVTAVLAREVGTDRGDLLVSFASEEEAAFALRRLVQAGIAVSAFAPVTGELEHTFLDLRDAGAQRGGAPHPTDPAPGSDA